jgi:hypothetical protein
VGLYPSLKLNIGGGFKSPYGSNEEDELKKLLESALRKTGRLEEAGIPVPTTPSEKKSKFNMGQFFDLLSRGEYSGATTFRELLKHGELPTGEELGKAIKGKDKYTYYKLLGDLGMKKGIPRSVLGFGLGIYGDPFTYIPIGGIVGNVLKVGKKVPVLRKGITKLDDILKAGKRAVGIKKIADKGVQEIDTLLKGISGRVAAETMETSKKYQPLLKALGSLDDVQKKLVRVAREDPDMPARLSKPAQKTLKMLNEMFQETGEEKLSKGIVKGLIGPETAGVKQLSLFNFGNDTAMKYLPHITTQEFYNKAIKEAGAQPDDAFEIIRGLVKKNLPRVEKNRTLFETIDTLNEWSMKKFGVNMFEEDLEKIIPKYLYSYSKNTALEEMAMEMTKIVDDAGDPLIKLVAKEAPEGMVKLSSFPFQNNFATTPELAKAINKVQGVLFSDPALNKLLKLADKGMRVWKSGATVYSPGAVAFNANNFLGATLMNGIYSISSLLNPKRVWDVVSGKPMMIAGKGGRKISSQEFMEQLVKRGALMTHTGTETFAKDMQKIGVKNIVQRLVSVPASLAEGVEKFVRTQLALDVYKKTGSISDAVRAVWKVHGNYAPEAMTKFEREVVKRVFPFYTWLKTSIPFQIENLYKKTGKYAAIAKAERALVGDDVREGMPDWLQDRFIVKKGETEGGKKTATSLDLPIRDLFKLTSMKEMASAVNPFLKVPAELGFNMSTFTGRPIANKELPKEYQTTKVPDWVGSLPDPAKKFLNVKKTTVEDWPTEEKKDQWEADATKWYMLMNLAGPVGRFSYASKRAEDMAKMGEGSGGISGVLEELSSPARKYAYSPEEQAFWDAYTRDKQLQEVINYLLKRGMIDPATNKKSGKGFYSL